MSNAHRAFDGFEDICEAAALAAQEAVKQVIDARMHPDGDVERLVDWSYAGDFSKSGGTIDFKITVYLTPLYEDEH